MRIDGHIGAESLSRLASLVGSELQAYGSDKPGVDSGVAVENFFIEAGGAFITLRVAYEPTDVCGEVGDYLHLVVEDGFSRRAEADAEGGVYFHFKGETIRSVIVHRATLERFHNGIEARRFERDAAIQFVLDSGSLVFLNDDLSTPILESLVWTDSAGSSLPDPAAGWPSTMFSNWTGSWSRYVVA